jgi:uncharacterized protein (TIGR02246 family)
MTPPNNNFFFTPGLTAFAPRRQAAVCPATPKPSQPQPKTCSVPTLHPISALKRRLLSMNPGEREEPNMMKTKVTPVALLSSLIGALAVPAFAQGPREEAAIRRIIQDEDTAWNKQDAVAYARHFAADGTFTNILSAFYEGYDAFVAEHNHIFKSIFLGSTLQQDIISLRFATPDVAVVEVLTAVSGVKIPTSRGDSFDAKGRLRT